MIKKYTINVRYEIFKEEDFSHEICADSEQEAKDEALREFREKFKVELSDGTVREDYQIDDVYEH